MSAKKRRKSIIDQIMSSSSPITGSELAKGYGVSRQVIVQDIAILRASGYEIIATPQGYDTLCLSAKGKPGNGSKT